MKISTDAKQEFKNTFRWKVGLILKYGQLIKIYEKLVDISNDKDLWKEHAEIVHWKLVPDPLIILVKKTLLKLRYFERGLSRNQS